MPLTGVGRARNPLDWDSPEDWVWTTVNTAEALPGVQLPLTWSFWEAAIEHAMRQCFYDFGVLRRSEVDHPRMTEERFTAMFAGRYACSINAMRRIGDRMLGTSGDAVEEQILGSVGSGIAPQPQPSRYVVAAIKMPGAVMRLLKRLRATRAQTDTWWRAQITPGMLADRDGAAARLLEARAVFADILDVHAVSTMLAQAAYDQVRLVCVAADLEGLERRLVTGYGDFEETRMAADLWAVSRDRLTLDEFLARHGFHGTREGTLESRSWRQDPGALLGLVEKYRAMPDTEDPAGSEEQRAAERRAAEDQLRRALPRRARPRGQAVLGFARRYVPLREVSKAAFLQAIDVGRANAHIHGEWLAARGYLDAAEDVFFLRLNEIEAQRTEGLRELVAERRSDHERFCRVRVPDTWTGRPELIPVDTDDDEGGEIRGIPVSSGVVEGRVYVVLDRDQDDDIEQGDILVCETTDPSWATWFLVASALVIDVGGVMSHGAIVARELGVPCVINTRIGTKRLRTGDVVRVDGDAGTVTVLKPAAGTQ